MLFFQGTALVEAQDAQVSKSAELTRRDTVIVEEGNLTYLRIDGRTFKKPDTINSTGKSYEYFIITSSFEKIAEEVLNPILRSVFTKERAKQLADLNVKMFLRYSFSPVENNKIIRFDFDITGFDNENFPLKLSELDELERKLRAAPNFIPKYRSEGEITNWGQTISMPIRFEKLYD